MLKKDRLRSTSIRPRSLKLVMPMRGRSCWCMAGERAISWRHQIPVLAAFGFRVIAPDHGAMGIQLSIATSDYALKALTNDMIGLIDALEIDQAVWVGHDWGSPVVFSVASHFPARQSGGCESLCSLLSPERTQSHHQLSGPVDLSRREPSRRAGLSALLRGTLCRGDPSVRCKPSCHHSSAIPKGRSRRAGTSCGNGNYPPDGLGGWTIADVPLDTDVLTEADLAVYAEGLERNGFLA